MLRVAVALALLLPLRAAAQDVSVVMDAVDNHALPRIEALAETGAALDAAAQADCTPDAVKPAFAAAFDAWTSASHLRFGPTETDNRAYALAFWPDTRGMGPKALKGLIAAENPVVDDPATFAQGSVAIRGYYALELMLYDPELTTTGSADYRCRLVRAITGDIAALTGAIAADWAERARLLETAGQNDTYRTVEEAVQEFYKALYLGLEFTANTRLGQPLGTFDRPRPTRAEARLSGRSLQNVELSLVSLADLSHRLSVGLAEHPDLGTQIDYAFGRAIETARELDDPVFEGVSDPMSRFRVESLQNMLFGLRDAIRGELGPALGVAEGFNALDGD